MKKITNLLLEWYDIYKRNLPWREDQDPYHVWISEIMLQQTRVETVIEYYKRFIKEIPSISCLATIEEDRLLKLWEGLGYYTRAKNLKKAAMIIQEKYNGKFPNTYEEILSLPGIGEYTASAIGSICFSLKEITIDGNVLRVYMRIYNCRDNIDDLKVKRKVRSQLKLIIPDRSGDFNQALMELGEIICLPSGIPKCEICPIKKYCQAYQEKTYMNLPIRNLKKQKKIERYTVLLICYHDQIAIQKREKKGLLSDMWQFPNIEGHLDLEKVTKYLTDYISIDQSIQYTHIFTHRKWNMISYYIKIDDKQKYLQYHFVTLTEMDQKYSIPTAFQPFKKTLEQIIK